MNVRHVLLMLATSLLVVAVVAACAPAPTPVPPTPVPPTAAPKATEAPKATTAPTSAPAALRKVTLYMPVPVKTIAMFCAIVPQELGYYQEEGLDVSAETAESSPFIVQQMASGKADAGLVVAGPAVSAWAQGLKLVAVWEMLTQPVFQQVVLDDSPVRAMQDLKGKQLGVKGLTGGDIVELTADLAKAGLTVGKDVQFQPLGEDMGPVLEALKAGKVAAFSASYNDIVRIESTGAKLRSIGLPVDPDKLRPSVPLLVRGEVVEKEPKVAIGLGRAMSKAIVFAKENPNAVLAIMKKAFPPEHSDASYTRLYLQRAIEMSWPRTGRLFGQQSLDGAQELIKLMVNPGAASGLQKEFDIKPFMTNDFVKEMNNFDVEKVKADAKASKLTYP